MEWLFDLGNTRLKWALLDAGALIERGALSHADTGFEQELAQVVDTLPRPRRVLLASVAGSDLGARVEAIIARTGANPERVRSRAEAGGIRIAYAEPDRLGVDRFACLVGARRRGPGPWLVAGVGTALTIDLLGADGLHLGGMIAPSPALMRESLARRAPQLDVAGGQRLDFAADTADALATGCEGAAIGLIVHACAAAHRRIGTDPGLLLAGGGAPALLSGLPMPHDHAPDLVLEGLMALASE